MDACGRTAAIRNDLHLNIMVFIYSCVKYSHVKHLTQHFHVSKSLGTIVAELQIHGWASCPANSNASLATASSHVLKQILYSFMNASSICISTFGFLYENQKVLYE